MQRKRSLTPSSTALSLHPSRPHHNTLKPIHNQLTNKSISFLGKVPDTTSSSNQVPKKRHPVKSINSVEDEKYIDDLIANRRSKQKLDQASRNEDSKYHRIQFSNIDKSGVKREWIASYKIGYDNVCYPSLKYQDVDQQNTMYLTNQVLTGPSKFSLILDSSNPDKSSATGIKSPPMSPKHDFVTPFYSNTKSDEANPDEFRFNAKTLHIIKPAPPQPNWTLKITHPSSSDHDEAAAMRMNEGYDQEADKIMMNGELKRREQMSLRYKVYSGNDSMAQRRLTHQRKLATPSIDDQAIAKSPKGIKRIELEEDRLYRELKEHSKQYIPPQRNIEELIFEEEKDKLAPILESKEHAHSMEGLLYYRFKNSLRMQQQVPTNRLTSLPSMDKQTPQVERRRSAFLRKLNDSSVLDPTKLPNPAEVFAESSKTATSSEESSTTTTAAAIAGNLKVTRVQRAIDARMKGFDYHDIVSDPNHYQNPLLNDRYLDSSKLSDSSSVVTLSSKPTQMMSQQQVNLNKRNAQDILTLSQLDQKIVPEQLIKKNIDDDQVLVDLSHYGIGNANGRCLADALAPLDQLSSLCLHDNRLDTNTISYIIRKLPASNLHHIDLSKNDLHMFACEAISSYLQAPNQVVYLNISDSQLDSSDLMIIAQAMKKSIYCHVTELNLSHNKISGDGIHHLCQYLRQTDADHHHGCTIQSLDLSWNRIDSHASIDIADALLVNRSLRIVNLSMNPTIHEAGGKRIASALAINNSIQELHLNQCNIGYGTCFILAQVLRKQSTIKLLDLSSNPLGEAGARSLFRTMLHGIKSIIRMENCEYPIDERVFNHSYPAEHSPYTFDMTESYDRAVLEELVEIACHDPINSKFTSVFYQEVSSGAKDRPVTSIKLMVSADRILCDRNNGLKWSVPDSGRLTVHFESAIVIPTSEKIINDQQLHIISDIIANGRTDVDRKAWLRMISSDVYYNTNQIERLITNLQSRKVLSDGGLSRLDLLICVWSRLVDPQNQFDFLEHNLDLHGRKELIYALGFDNFRFNWINPTGHWRFNLAERFQRVTFQQIVAINSIESEYSRTISKHGDTSQWVRHLSSSLMI
jgi:hypothetical protein